VPENRVGIFPVYAGLSLFYKKAISFLVFLLLGRSLFTRGRKPIFLWILLGEILIMEYDNKLEKKLATYLSMKMPQSQNLTVHTLAACSEGSSYETYSFHAEWTDGCKRKEQEFVLRMEPEVGVWEPYDIVPQYQVLKGLQSTPIPVPKVHWLELDKGFLGKRFFIMDYVEGEIFVPFDRTTPFLSNRPLQEQMAREYLEVLAQIHQVKWQELGFSKFLSVPNGPTDHALREIDRWEQLFYKRRLAPEPIIVEALIWLKKHIPKARDSTLLHGDYEMINIMWQGNRIVAILDWENVGIGDPMDDLGWTCMEFWRMPRPSLINNLIERERLYGLYEELTGRIVDPEHVRYWEVMGNLKLLIILLCGMKAFEEGKVQRLRFGVMDQLYFVLLNHLATMLGI
jgi:aminoglycoside phosphotransferase (APT) family kinase protein